MLPHSPPLPFSTHPTKDTVWLTYHTVRQTKWEEATHSLFYFTVDFGLGKHIFIHTGGLG